MSRRGVLGAGAATGLLALGACSAAEPRPAPPPSAPPVPKTGMHLVTLGTKGGPTLRSDRSSPANALVVDGVVYVVDCGMGVSRQLVLAGLELSAVRAVFITHHHSDHNLEFGNLLNAAWNANLTHRIGFHAPPGMADMLAGYLAMNRYDIDVRIADQGLPDPRGLAEAREFTGDGEVYRDELVRARPRGTTIRRSPSPTRSASTPGTARWCSPGTRHRPRPWSASRGTRTGSCTRCSTCRHWTGCWPRSRPRPG
ncbi:MBL fold metallo-hydrolase [Amycolatopsis samaneae]|uniref:MBL fold metallo-hydrolase n=1 Tax=Amycolatopsis samaneae TaxID=664691 RepID=A0ABW5GUF9_9PSEU